LFLSLCPQSVETSETVGLLLSVHILEVVQPSSLVHCQISPIQRVYVYTHSLVHCQISPIQLVYVYTHSLVHCQISPIQCVYVYTHSLVHCQISPIQCVYVYTHFHFVHSLQCPVIKLHKNQLFMRLQLTSSDKLHIVSIFTELFFKGVK